jgi:hypothetical protein
MFTCPEIKHYKELWRVEDRGHPESPKSGRAETAIKTVRERIRRNPLWKQNIMSRKLNILTQTSRASSGTSYTLRTAHLRSKDVPFLLFIQFVSSNPVSLGSVMLLIF